MGDEGLTAFQLYQDLVAAHRQEKPPEGWVMAKDFAQDTGLSVSRAREVLNEMVAKGTMQAGEYPAPNGRARALYYGFVKDARGKMQDAGCKGQDAGCRMQDGG